MYDILIIGGGVIGCAIARVLSKYDIKLALVEAESDVATAATAANSGIVHAGYDAEPGTLKALYNVKGNKLYKKWSGELDFPYKNTGSLVVAFNAEEEDILKQLVERAAVNNVPDVSLVSGSKAREIEPSLSVNVTSALFAASAGITSPYSVAYACMENAAENGAEFYFNFRVTAIEYTDCFTVRSASGRELRAHYVINAAGVNSDTVASLIGDNSFQIQPRRGEYILYDKTDFVKIPVFPAPGKTGKGILVSPTVHGNLFIGPTGVDTSDKNNLETTAGGANALIEKAGDTVKAFNFYSPITAFTGMRAISGHDFVIGKSEANERFINVAGICSPGLTAAPAIAEAVGGMFKGYPQKVNYNPKRRGIVSFHDKTNQEKKALTERNPLYKNVICRCETVTEAEIVEAIKRGATTVDGVKRRVRAGMGRCQGGFCLPRILSILSRELNVPVEEITKRGGNSYYVYGNVKEAGYEKE